MIHEGYCVECGCFVKLDDDGACANGHDRASVHAMRVAVEGGSKPTYLSEDAEPRQLRRHTPLDTSTPRRRRERKNPVPPVWREETTLPTLTHAEPEPLDENAKRALDLAAKRLLVLIGITAVILLIGGGLLGYIASRNVFDAYEQSLILRQQQSVPATSTENGE